MTLFVIFLPMPPPRGAWVFRWQVSPPPPPLPHLQIFVSLRYRKFLLGTENAVGGRGSGSVLEYRNRSYIEVRRGGGFWPMGPALYRVIYVLTMVPNTVEQGKYSWNSLLGQWCWAMWPQERHFVCCLPVCSSVVCLCLLSVSCQLSVVSCQLSVVKVSPFPRVENRRSDCVTPLQWTGSASLPAVSMTGLSLYWAAGENMCEANRETRT